MSYAMLAAAALQVIVASVPPAPPPPPVARDPAARAAIDAAVSCVDADDGQNAAEQATAGLNAAAESEAWRKARDVVATYVDRRDAARKCINRLEKLRFSNGFNQHDQDVLTATEKRLISSWWRRTPSRSASWPG